MDNHSSGPGIAFSMDLPIATLYDKMVVQFPCGLSQKAEALLTEPTENRMLTELEV
jgi:hypothetical protein